jgi:hypothetical protein
MSLAQEVKLLPLNQLNPPNRKTNKPTNKTEKKINQSEKKGSKLYLDYSVSSGLC